MPLDAPKLNRHALPWIDLYHDCRLQRRAVLRRSRRDIIVLGLLTLFVGSLLMPLTRQVAEARGSLAAAQRQRGDIEKRRQVVNKRRVEVDEHLSRFVQYAEARSRRLAVLSMLTELARRMPASIYLESARIEGEAKIAVELQGSAETMEALNRYSASLVGSKVLGRVHLAESSADATIGPRGMRFKLTGDAASTRSGSR